MKRTRLIYIVFILALAVLPLALLGCLDKGSLPENYVEVTGLRIDSANVYLSPSGETANYQLNVEILPTNATNRALTYYVPSQYLPYVTVSDTGLISAKLATEEGMSIPLTVTSTTNKKATLQVSVIIEYVSVKEIAFTKSETSLLYNGGGEQLSVVFTPYHAQDGRAIEYSSLNEQVATVNGTGWVTPVSSGNTTIIATGKTAAGKTIEGRISVKVRYAEGKYRLEVSDTTPQYRQILGDFKAINFNLLILDSHSDPNARIQWYVDGERVVGKDGNTEYEHIPSVSTKTSYKVSVKIKPKDEAEQEIFSETISIFNPFKGFNFVTANIAKASGNGYQYGDNITFPLTVSAGNISYYEWYLKHVGGLKSVKVATTYAANKDLTARLNVEGDFILSAKGYDADGKLLDDSQSKTFSVSRYVVGDTVVITPSLIDDGIPPESYNWFKYECTATGEYVGSSVYVGNSVYGKSFYYPLTSNGNIILVAQAMLNGVVATVNDEPFEQTTGIIRVFGTGGEDSVYSENLVSAEDYGFNVSNDIIVQNVNIEGIMKNGNPCVNIHWDVVGGMNGYVVEITKENGEVELLDSMVSNSGFGDYYVTVAQTIVTLSDKFTVRVKQKGGMFSERYHYGYEYAAEDDSDYYFESVSEKYYSYLSTVFENENRYVLSMKELGELMDYTLLFKPKSNSYVTYSIQNIDGVNYDSYSLRVRLGFDYSDEIAAAYPVTVDDSGLSDIYKPIYKMTAGILSAYCETGDYKITFNYHSDDMTYDIAFLKAISANEIKTTDAMEYTKGDSVHYSKTPYGATVVNFAIDSREAVSVSDSDQLYAVAEKGKLPVPANDSTASVYAKAKLVVKSIIGEEMTDAQKVLAFFNYLTVNIVYDTQIQTMLATAEITEYGAYDYDSFHLEGVFNRNKAICDGIAKAMSLLCAIEGIPCVKVSGSVKSGETTVGHSWNKVKIDGVWYNVDATYGIKTDINKVQYANHKYFLMTDAQFAAYYASPIVLGEYVEATTVYDFFGEIKVNECSLTINDQQSFDTLLNSFGMTLEKKIYIEIKLNILGESAINTLIDNAMLTGTKRIDSYILMGDSRVIIIMS